MSLIEKLQEATKIHETPKVSATLDSLLESKKITHHEHSVYLLFGVDEKGGRWVKNMIEETFMDGADPSMYTGEWLAYADGRRSIIRDIKVTIERVNQLLRGDYE